VVVPDDETGASVVFGGKISAVNEDGSLKVDLNATFDGKTVLAKAFAIVKAPK
jgi:hypothetical protein